MIGRALLRHAQAGKPPFECEQRDAVAGTRGDHRQFGDAGQRNEDSAAIEAIAVFRGRRRKGDVVGAEAALPGQRGQGFAFPQFRQPATLQVGGIAGHHGAGTQRDGGNGLGHRATAELFVQHGQFGIAQTKAVSFLGHIETGPAESRHLPPALAIESLGQSTHDAQLVGGILGRHERRNAVAKQATLVGLVIHVRGRHVGGWSA